MTLGRHSFSPSLSVSFSCPKTSRKGFMGDRKSNHYLASFISLSNTTPGELFLHLGAWIARRMARFQLLLGLWRRKKSINSRWTLIPIVVPSPSIFIVLLQLVHAKHPLIWPARWIEPIIFRRSKVLEGEKHNSRIKPIVLLVFQVNRPYILYSTHSWLLCVYDCVLDNP